MKLNAEQIKVNINLTLWFENKGEIEKVIPYTIYDSDICDLIYDDFENHMRYNFNIEDAFFNYTACINEFIDEIIEQRIDNIIDEQSSQNDDEDILDYDWTWEMAK